MKRDAWAEVVAFVQSGGSIAIVPYPGKQEWISVYAHRNEERVKVGPFEHVEVYVLSAMDAVKELEES